MMMNNVTAVERFFKYRGAWRDMEAQEVDTFCWFIRGQGLGF